MIDLASGAESPEHELTATPCATDIRLYLHPLLEEPPVRSTAPPARVRGQERLGGGHGEGDDGVGGRGVGTA